MPPKMKLATIVAVAAAMPPKTKLAIMATMGPIAAMGRIADMAPRITTIMGTMTGQAHMGVDMGPIADMGPTVALAPSRPSTPRVVV